MAQYIVTADVLNVRSETPQSFSDPNVVATLNKGHIFDGTPVPDDQLTNPDLGPFITDNSTGNVVSGNWVVEGEPSINTSIITPPVNYNTLVQNIPDSWRNTGGTGIIVAILDTGCFPHDALKGAIVAQYNAI